VNCSTSASLPRTFTHFIGEGVCEITGFRRRGDVVTLLRSGGDSLSHYGSDMLSVIIR
jgi:hypothetical protein